MDRKAIIFNVQRYCIHDGPGIRTTVFMKGCPLRCLWCANPESQKAEIETDCEGTVYGEYKTISEVMDIILKDTPFYEESGGGVTISGGEPLLQTDFVRALLAACQSQGIHTAVETTGCISPLAMESVVDNIDLFLFDVKHYDTVKHRAGTGVDNGLILRNLRFLAERGKEIVARIPVIPGFNSSLEDAKGLSALLTDIGIKRVDLLPFHQFGEKKYALLGMEYTLEGAPALKEESLKAYKEIMKNAGLVLG